MTLFQKNKIAKAHKIRGQTILNSNKKKLFSNFDSKNTSFFLTTIAVSACNSSNSKPNQTEPCQDFNSSQGYICIDDDLNEILGSNLISTIPVSDEQTPVSGTDASDTFVASSAYLNNKSVIDGGNGSDTLILKLNTNIKNSPSIKNELFSYYW